jgi:hypothetical protein
MSSRAPPAPAARARPGPGGRVLPAADGRASPFLFQKELYRNGASREGTRDSGRTFVLSSGPRLSEWTGPPVGGRQHSTTRSLPSLASGRLGWNLAFLGLCTVCTQHALYINRERPSQSAYLSCDLRSLCACDCGKVFFLIFVARVTACTWNV